MEGSETGINQQCGGKRVWETYGMHCTASREARRGPMEGSKTGIDECGGGKGWEMSGWTTRRDAFCTWIRKGREGWERGICSWDALGEGVMGVE